MSDSRYLSYYKKLLLFKRYERKTPVSSLLDLASIPIIDSPVLNENCINSKNLLVKLIRGSEKKYDFIYEGLIKTYPTDKNDILMKEI